MRSGAPSTVKEATEPANMPISKPSCSAMRAEIGSNTEPGWTQRDPLRMARNRWRRSVQCIGAPPSRVGLWQRNRRVSPVGGHGRHDLKHPPHPPVGAPPPAGPAGGEEII